MDVSPYTETIDTDSRRHEAYYSQFQIFELDRLAQSLTFTVEIDWALESDGTIDAQWGDDLKPNLASHAERVAKRSVSNSESSFGAICQVISDGTIRKRKAMNGALPFRKAGCVSRLGLVRTRSELGCSRRSKAA